MRIIILMLFALAACVKHTAAQQATAPYMYNYALEMGRELPRTQLLSYNSEQASIERSHGSAIYIQPLNDLWVTDDRIGGATKTFARGFTMPFAWVDREVFLYVGSVKGEYEVVVNGEVVGSNSSSRTAGEFNITRFTVEGANRLEIKVGASNQLSNEKRVDITEAISGEIYLTAQPKVRIREYVTTVDFKGADATVQLGVVLKTHLLNKKEVRLYYKLLSPLGEDVASGHRDVELGKRGEDTVRFLVNIPNVHPWSHETPELYTLLLKTQHEGRYTEYVSYKMGMRTVGIKGGKLLINSFALPLSVAEYSLRADSAATHKNLLNLKNEGYNLVKIADFPQPYYFYDICDVIGMYVCDQADINTARHGEARTKEGNPSNNPQMCDLYLDRVVAMYNSSRNHPSVVMFSTAVNSSNGYNLYESYVALKRIEKQAPIVYMDAAGEWNSDAVSGELRASNPIAAADRMVFDVGNDPRGRVASPPYEIVAMDGLGGYRITNNQHVTSLRGDLVYTIRQGSKVVDSGRIPLSVNPQASTEIDITPATNIKSGKALKYDVKVVPSGK